MSETFKDYIRKCAEAYRCNGELTAKTDGLMMAEKLAEKLDNDGAGGGGSEPFIVFRRATTGFDDQGSNIYENSINIGFSEWLQQIESQTTKPMFAIESDQYTAYMYPMMVQSASPDKIVFNFNDGTISFEFKSDGTIVRPAAG